jgi:tetratricopeptide (TPR) repeat protein
MEWRQWSDTPDASLKRAYDEAQTAIEIAKAKGANSANAHGALAMVYLAQGEFDKTVQEYTIAHTLDVSDPDLAAEVGLARIYLGEPEKAVDQIEVAMRMNPNHPWWYESMLGWAHYQAKQYEDAIEVINRVSPLPNTMRLTLAASNARLGKKDQAHEEIVEFLKNEPWSIADEQGAPFKNPDDEKHWLDGLRLAGLPEHR